ncbi:MAG: SDR family NAD(P)-dependent oxidoreductase [Chloroflexota bacterium]|uniref:Short-chain dehydrogenase n=1 Tax=marine metagenome TaxID=408172 RepID=A0A381YZ60_9ZZZZ|nr:SDR family NAD(P)-dependent oxidoreductase [Chloroflexota bacterium]|tara:strand:- start:83 stop:823 length:741 start_codon:yes stop_codon:yes gene_type:complete
MNLSGKVALITGSGRNIGRATAIELARRGAVVTVNSRRNQQEADSVRDEIIAGGGTAISVIADVGVESEVAGMFEEIEKTLGNVAILVNNAGLRSHEKVANMTTEEWRRVLAVNLDGPFFCARAAIPAMSETGWGRIINVSGLNAFAGRSEWGHVCASKMGAIGLTRALSPELAATGILVNHIVPGAFDTSRESPTGTNPVATDSIPVGRLGMPEEIANTVAFLASDHATYITGQTIHVNGGALRY